MLQTIKNYSVKKCFLVVLASFFWVSAVYAVEQPLLILEGPDVVAVGTSTTYSVSTQGGTDSSYTWILGFSTNDSATLDQNGVLTANNPGIAGIMVIGNNTGVKAELYIDVVSAQNSSGVVITGPDKIVVGTTETFSVSTIGGSGGNHAWVMFSEKPSNTATFDVKTGELTGVSEGTVQITAMDLSTGAYGTKTVEVFASEKHTAKVEIAHGFGEFFNMDAIVSIRGDIPEDASLYIALYYDEQFHFLPSGTTTMEPFRTNPQETNWEMVYSVPISDIPFKEYTFYAGLLDSQLQLVSNLSSFSIKAGTQSK